MKKIFSFSILISLLTGGLVLAQPNIIEVKKEKIEVEEIAPQFEFVVPRKKSVARWK